MTTTGDRRLGGPTGHRRGRLAAHIETCRPDSSFYVGLVGVAGALVASPDGTPWQLAGCWLAPTFGWLASLYGGDYFDRDLDAIGKQHRSLPSGRMRPREAFSGMMVAIVLGTIIAALLNPVNLVLVALAGALGVSYSRWLKARGILGNIARGGPTAFSLLLGAISVTGKIPLSLLPVALMFWIHDSSSNLVGALCDMDTDGRGGYLTFPVRHGDLATVRLVALLDICWVALAIGWLAMETSRTVNAPVYACGLAIAVVLALISLVILRHAPRPIPRLAGLRSHEVIVLERLILPCTLIAATEGLPVALALFLPSLAITRSAQIVMRSRYEPGRSSSRAARWLR